MSDARRWTDCTGRVRWQPVTRTGRGMWTGATPGSVVWEQARQGSWSSPIMYRSRRRAVRVARRRERDEARTTWTRDPDPAEPPNPPPPPPDPAPTWEWTKKGGAV